VLFHPKLPLIASASEDGTVRLWSSTTYRAESTLNYGMERAWALAATEESNMLACGFDEGCVVVELGNDDPVASMDNTGKVIFAKNNEIQSANVRGLASSSGDEEALPDGERLPVIPRDLGACELYPQMLKHNCNGRFVAVCGDGEFIIYTALNLRNKAFGQALDFAWSGTGTGDYCIRESISRIKFFKNFKESNSIRPATSSAEGLFGGHCVGVKGGDGSILFYDWESGTFIRKIDVDAKEVYWSDSGNMVCIATEDSAYVLSYDAQATAAAVAMGEVNDEVGIEGTFDLLYEISDTVTSGKWVGDCFIFLNNGGRLNYIVGGQVQTLVHLETSAGGVSKHSVLGYLAKEDRVYLVDKSLNITSYSVMLSVLEYQTAVMRGDFDAANELLATIPESQYTTVARFLESQGFKEEAMAVTTDPDHKFDLALELDHVDIAHSLMQETPEEDKDATDTMTKWKKLSDAALKASNFDLCESASQASNDYAGLLLMYSAIGNYVGLENLAKSAEADGKTNIAFSAYLLTGNVEACAEILISTNRLPEAAFFARTYLPSRVDEIVAMWKADLSKVSESAAAALISPSMDKESFPDFDVGLQVEQMFMDQRASNKEDGIPATDYLSAKDDLDLDLVDLVKSRSQAAEPVAPPPAESPEMEDDNGEEKVPDEETDIVDSDTIEADEAMKAQLEALAAEQALQDQITLEMEARAAEEARMQAEAAAVEVDETEETTEVETEEIADAPVDVENKDTMNDFGDDW
jgi:coatomer subunit beta'